MNGEGDREYLIARIESLERQVELRFEGIKEAVTKAEAATEKRFEGVNEFRAQLNDQTRTFLPRETFEQANQSWSMWRATVDAKLSEREGKESGSDKTIAYIFAALGGIGTLIGIILVVGDVLTP